MIKGHRSLMNANSTRLFKNKASVKYTVLFFLCSLFFIGLTGCASIISSTTSDMMTHLSESISNNDDLEIVEAGAPAYLLMIDSFILKDPDNQKMLYTAAGLYASYADFFITDPVRSKRMANKALEYAKKAICLSASDACDLKSKSFEGFTRTIADMNASHVPVLFALGDSWARWIMANKTDFDALADIAHIEVIMKRVTQLEPDYRDGAAYLYLGTLASLFPPALGGNPELGRAYFETALTLARDKNLMAKVLYAKFYARMIFDRPLHDRLLKEVLKADPYVPGYTLVNTRARQQAERLLMDADDYF